MKSAIFNPLAARELGEAVEYYDEARRGLGEEFLHEVERAIAFLDQYPEAAPKVGREVRRLVLARFPLLGDLSPPGCRPTPHPGCRTSEAPTTLLDQATLKPAETLLRRTWLAG